MQAQAQVLPGESFQPPLLYPSPPLNQQLRLSVHLNNHRRPGTFPAKDQSNFNSRIKFFCAFEDYKDDPVRHEIYLLMEQT